MIKTVSRDISFCDICDKEAGYAYNCNKCGKEYCYDCHKEMCPSWYEVKTEKKGG